MTSLLLGLRGTFGVKEKFARHGNPDAWTKQSLFLDLLKDPALQPEDDDELDVGVTYGFKFAPAEPRNDHHHHWIKVGTILDCEAHEKLDLLIAKIVSDLHVRATEFDKEIVVSSLRRLHQVVWADETINYFTETNQSSDRVLDIFVRANDGGTKLDKSDLLMSMITSKWSAGTAREDIFGFVGYVRSGLAINLR